MGQLLLERQILTESQLALSLNEQKRTGEKLGKVLQSLGFITEDLLSSVLAFQSGVEQVDLATTVPDTHALEAIPKQVVKRELVIPLSIKGRILTLAMANPFDVLTIDRLEKTTGLKIKSVCATETDIIKAIDAYYEGAANIELILEECIREAEDFAHNLRKRDDENSAIIRLVNHVFIKAVTESATDIHIEPEENVVRTRFRIDGVLRQGPALPKALQMPLVTRIKIMSNLNIPESRLPQDGRYLFQIGKKKVDCRISTLPTTYGENVVIRVLDKSRITLNPRELGLSAIDMGLLESAFARPYGMILVTGPTGSGKTTTLYAVLSKMNSLEKNILTLEDPVEYDLPVIRQTQINRQAGLTFAACLRSVLRQDPDVILVGETRDHETAELSVNAALTGHLVFSTLHTNDACGAVPRLIEMGIKPYLLASALHCVVAQRLVRRICPSCKTVDDNHHEQLAKLGLDPHPGAQFFKGKGCENCYHTGYKGRAGVYEILVIDDEVRRLILIQADSGTIADTARKSGMRTLLEDGVVKAEAGLTSLAEVIRVCPSNAPNSANELVTEVV
jgi:type IV pilus assembly protein PilB